MKTSNGTVDVPTNVVTIRKVGETQNAMVIGVGRKVMFRGTERECHHRVAHNKWKLVNLTSEVAKQHILV